MAERTTKVTLVAQVNGYIAGMEKAANATKKMSKDSSEALAKQKESFEMLGRASLTAGTLALAGAALATKAAMDWETAWTGVTKTVDGTPEQLEAIQDGLRGMARELPIAHKELAAVAEAAGQLGVEQGSILEFTRTMVDLGQTTNLSAEEAATAIAKMMNVMQTAPGDVDRLGAALVQLGNNGASTERDIVMMASRIAGAGKTVGLTEAEVLGLANALSSVGVEVEAGGSAISKIMIDIAKSVSAGGKDLDEFAKVAGLSSADFARSFKGAPAEAIASFVEGLGKLDASGGDVFATLETLGQTDIRTTRALLNMANSGDLLRKSLTLGNEAWEDNTALVDEAAKRYDTTASKVQVAGNSIVDAAISFGEVFLPAVSAASDGIAIFADGVGAMPKPLMGVVGIVTVLGGVAAVSGGAFLLAVPKVAAYKAALATMGTTAQRTSRIVTTSAGVLGVAFVAAAAVLGIFTAAQANAKARTEEFSGTLDQQTGKVTEASRELVKANLATKNSFLWMESDSAFDAAKKLGIELDVVTDAALGNAGAMKELKGALVIGAAGSDLLKRQMDETGLSALELSTASSDLKMAVEGSAGSLDEAARVTKQKASVDGDAAGAANGHKKTLDELAGAAEGAGQEIAGLADLIRGFGATSLSARDAERQFQSAIDDATDAVAENGKTLDINSEAGRNNEAALDAIAKSALESAASILEQTGSQEGATAAINDGRAALIEQLAKFGITGEAAETYIDKLGLIPENIETAVIINTDPAELSMQRFLARWNGATVNLRSTTSPKLGSGVLGFADGGTVHGPGTSKSDSVAAMLSVGEEVTPEPQASKYRSLLKDIAADRFGASQFASSQYSSAPQMGSAPTSQGAQVNMPIYAQPGMSAETVGRIAADQLNWNLRSA